MVIAVHAEVYGYCSARRVLRLLAASLRAHARQSLSLRSQPLRSERSFAKSKKTKAHPVLGPDHGFGFPSEGGGFSCRFVKEKPPPSAEKNAFGAAGAT